ncbi:MAG: hypothetical protein AAF471_08505 [Myxococcota bacterium]
MPYSKLTVVLDIDGTLVCDPSEGKEGFDEIVKRLGEEFAKEHLVPVQDYVFPLYIGVPQMLRALWQHKTRIVLFSSGTQERNKLLVPALLRHVFGQEAGKAQEAIAVYSRHHCIDTYRMPREKDDQLQPDISILFHGYLKKDLRVVHSDPQCLRDTVLMDDDTSYMLKGQEKNFLYAHSGRSGLASRDRVVLEKGEEPKELDDARSHFYHAFRDYGILHRAVGLMKQETGLHLDDALYRIQVEQEHTTFDKKFYYPSKNRYALYEEGLQALRHIDPRLDFLRP